MKEEQFRQILQQRYGEVPPETHAAFMGALIPGKEENTVKKKKLMLTPALAIILVLMLATTAVAATTQALEWYYANRYTNVQPEERDAVLSHVKPPVAQQQSENSVMDMTAQEYSWLAEEKRLIVALQVTPKTPETVELHHMGNLDTDGSYVGGDAPLGKEDGEDRGDHWLWTRKGCGPVQEMMLDPNKTLYLFDVDMGASPAEGGRMCSLDAYDTEEGGVQLVLEYDLSGIPAGTSSVELTIPYTTVAYTEDDAVLYGAGHQQHYVKLTVDLSQR